MPLTWSQLRHALSQGDYDTVATRTPATLRRYKSTAPFTRQLLLDTLFSKEDYMLTRNLYPYDVTAYHYILWCRHPTSAARAMNLLQTCITGEFLCYQNPTYHRSVTHTQHFHVFTRWEQPSITKIITV